MAGGTAMDDLARRLVEPMSRRRAVRLLAGAAVAAVVPGIARGASACKTYICPGTACHHPNGGCAENHMPCAGGGCCLRDSQVCCAAGSKGCGGCCDVDKARCSNGICVADVCRWTEKEFRQRGLPKEVEEKQKYDPDKQCCTTTGVQPKFTGWEYVACQPTMVAKKGFKPRTNGCGPKGSKVPDSYKKASFKEACNAHDLCYSQCGSQFDQCNAQLKADMLASCQNAYGLTPKNPTPSADYARCIEYVDLYRAGVGAGGIGYYMDAQREGCNCCP